MSSTSLSLGTIRLEDPKEKTLLVVKTTAGIRFEEPYHQLPLLEEALTSGTVWISRRAGLCLDIEILVNGQPVEKNCRLQFLESVGYRICDAKFWSSLSLITLLDIPAETQKPNFYIRINQNDHFLDPGSTGIPPSREDEGIPLPSSVTRATLEKINIRCDFIDSNINHTPKGRKTEFFLPRSPDVMLLDFQLVPVLEMTPAEIETKSAMKLTSSMSKSNSDINLSAEIASRVASMKQPSRGHTFPKHIVDILKIWIIENPRKLRPDPVDKQQLIQQTGLQFSSILRAIKYYRKKLLGKEIENDSEMLLKPGMSIMPQTLSPRSISVDRMHEDEDEILLLQDMMELDSEEMLFSESTCMRDEVDFEVTILTPSLTEASYKKPGTSIGSLSASGVDLNSTGVVKKPLSRLEISSHLVDMAVRALVSGYFSNHYSQGVLLREPLPEISLQNVAPSIFNFGFNKLMTRNARYISTITRTSLAILSRSQSPMLKEKLIKLTHIGAPCLVSGDQEISQNKDQKTPKWIEARLWSMMHKALFDTSSARKIWRTKPDENVLDDFEDLLYREPTKGPDEKDGTVDSDFDDLLDDEQDESFYDCLREEEQEKLDTEHETEEMLFGCCEETDDEAQFLLGDEIDEDSLLI